MVNLKRWFNVIKILSLSNNMKQRTKKAREDNKKNLTTMEAKHEIKQNIVQRLHDERTDGRTSNTRCPSIYPFIYS